jgi:hypothetical protein
MGGGWRMADGEEVYVLLLRTGLILPNCVDKVHTTHTAGRGKEAEVPWRWRKVALGTLGSTSRQVRAFEGGGVEGRGRCSAYPVDFRRARPT